MPSDLDRLQGSWRITGLEADGQKVPAEMVAGSRMLVQGDRFTSTGMGSVYEGRLELDESQQPRHFALRFDAGPEKGNTNLGIYELAGDRWTICLATRGSVRPATFASTPGSGFAVETLVRGEAAPAGPSRRGAATAAAAGVPAGPLSPFEGEWRLVSAV